MFRKIFSNVSIISAFGLLATTFMVVFSIYLYFVRSAVIMTIVLTGVCVVVVVIMTGRKQVNFQGVT